jgi:hypothetical protein
MEGLTFKKVGYEEKSIAEIEQEVIEEVVADEVVADEVPEEKIEEAPVVELDDDAVLSHIRTKYNKEIDTIDDLFKERVSSEELSEDVAAFNKYKKETGRGIEDFVNLHRDLDKVDPTKLLSDFYKENGDDEEDVEYRMRKFRYDEDLDSEDEIEEKKIALKQELKKAKKHFNEQKEQYSTSLESREPLVPEADRNDYESYKANKTRVATEQEEQLKKSNYFVEKTNELFTDSFEGFGFKVGDDKVVYKPTDMNAEKAQTALTDLIGSFLDDNGYVKDVEKFQRAMTVANDPEKFANFFYDKGKSDSVTNFEKDGKNIDMVRGASVPSSKSSGLQLKIVNDGNNNNKFKITKR